MDVVDGVATGNGLVGKGIRIALGLKVLSVKEIARTTLARRLGQVEGVARVFDEVEFNDAVATMHRLQGVVVYACAVELLTIECVGVTLTVVSGDGRFIGVVVS